MRLLQVIDHAAFGVKWLETARECAPYVDMLWLRIKNVSDEFMAQEARTLREALPGAVLMLSGNADIARECGFNGVQLGAGTERPESVKERYPDMITGYSAHTQDEIEDIEADHYTLSPIFETKKDYEVKPLGAVDVSSLRRKIYALGGVTSWNVAKLRDKGYCGVAGISFHKELPELRRLISLW